MTHLLGSCPELQSLHEAIRASPGDDVPRLAYADLLDRSGDESDSRIAAFLRQQIRLPAAVLVTIPVQWTNRYLLPIFPKAGVRRVRRRADPEDAIRLELAELSSTPPAWTPWLSLTVRRGFVSAVDCPLASWEEYGPALCAVHPVVTARPTCCFPKHVERDPGFSCWTWHDGKNVIPDPIARRLRKAWHPTDDAAWGEMSEAMLAFAHGGDR